MTLIHFKNCTVLDTVAGALLPGHNVVVEGETIREVSERPVKSARATAIDLKGKTLMPGLIDAHVHAIAVEVNLAVLPSLPVTLLAHQASAILAGMLRRGFTTIRDAGGAAFGRSADGVPEVRRAARDELRKGVTQIKIMASGGVASPNDPVWNLQYSEEEVRAIVEEAAAWHTYVMAHAYAAEAIHRSISFGVRSIEHGNLIDAATARHVAAHDAFVVPTLDTYEAAEREGLALGMPAVSIAKLKDVRHAGVGALAHLKEAGVKI